MDGRMEENDMKSAKGGVKKTGYRKRDYQAFIYIAPWLLGFLIL